jgi:hypothetical protein
MSDDRVIPFPELPDPDDDPDGFDEARRNDAFLRMVAMRAKHERDKRTATMTPLEIAEWELAAMLEFSRQYEADETSFTVTPSNTRALGKIIEGMRRRVEQMRSDAR